MKLIMENWRGYLAENQQTSYHDNLYLFENDTIKKTSFNDALDVLTESDDDIEAFLENWEKSIDYELQQLNEGIVGDFIFNASVKVFLFIDKIKDKIAKHVVKIIKFINKITAGLERFKQKHPTIYKIGKIIIYVIILFLAYYTLRHIIDFASQGCPMAEGDYIAEGDCIGTGFGSNYDPDAVRASEEQLRYIGDALVESGNTEIGQQFLDIANNPENVQFKELGLRMKGEIIARVKALDLQGIEIDSADMLVSKAEYLANNLPPLDVKADFIDYAGSGVDVVKQGDMVIAKVRAPATDTYNQADLFRSLDQYAQNAADGATGTVTRGEKGGFFYSILKLK